MNIIREWKYNRKEFDIKNEINIILENSSSDTKAIKSLVKIFYIHIIKWYCQPERQSTSWIGSIYVSHSGLLRFKDKLAFKKYNNDDNINIFYNSLDIAEKEMNRKVSEDQIDFIMNEFGTLSDIANVSKLSRFLYRYANSKSKIDLQNRFPIHITI